MKSYINLQAQDRTWKKPHAGFMKCNIDAYIQTNDQRIGLGMIIRDITGNFIAGRSLHLIGNPLIKEAEAICLLEALL